MMTKLKGKKTYLVVAVLFVLGGLHTLGYVDDTIYRNGVALLAPLGLAALRDALTQ